MTAKLSPDGRPSLLSLRTRWARLPAAADPPALTVRLLASYTVDPLVPYLGLRLHDSGLPGRLTVGPFNQIVQQCLDDGGETGQIRPDVLVVAPRFEELGAPADAERLLQAADAALAAAGRWRSCLVFFLPAIPEQRAYGAGDASRCDGTAAGAAAVRECLRSLLADQANVYVVDTEEAVRAIGARQAHRPALHRHARIPYSEEVFDLLAQQTAALLRIRYRGGRLAVVLDADSLVRDDSPLPGLDELGEPLGLIRQAATRLAVRGNRAAGSLWPLLDDSLPQLTRDPRVSWEVNERPLAAQLASLAAGYGGEAGRLVLITADGELASQVASAADGAVTCVVLGQAPEQWRTDLLAAGLLDAVAGPRPFLGAPGGPADAETRPAQPGQPARPGGRPAASVTLAEFIAGLDVRVAFRDLDRGLDENTAEVVDRAHDFTLGRPVAQAGHPDRGAFAFAADVTDRLGDYGTAAVVAGYLGEVCRVDVFSVSCPALGRGVEQAVLREIVARADAAGCGAVVLEYQETGRNRVAVDFLRHAAASWPAPSGREVRVRATRTGTARTGTAP